MIDLPGMAAGPGLRRAAAIVALAAAAWLGGVAVVRGTYAVGGSDSSCYALTAQAFAGGRLFPAASWAAQAPWPDVPRTLAPAGFVPDPASGHAVPVCAPGYGALLAPLVAVHRQALFLAAPMAAASLVWWAFVLGTRLGAPAAGASAAVLVALSPIVVFQAVQPMNDIVTGALWVGVAAAMTWPHRQAPLAAGLVTGIALLVRPNLLPAGVVAGLGVVAMHVRSSDGAGLAARLLRPALAFAAGTLPGGLAVLALHAGVYGSPFRSGYGDMRALFSAAHVWPNLLQHGGALRDTQTPWLALALIAPLVLRRGRRAQGAWSLALAVALAAGYLFYRPYEEWWYVRFLLPGVVISIVLAAAATEALLARLLGRGAVIALAVATVGLGMAETRAARAHYAYDVDRIEGKFRDLAAVAAARLPADAVVLTIWHSGTLRYNTGHDVLVWDGLDAAWLDRAVAWLEAHRRPVYIAVERWEEPRFRARFAGQRYGGLDWPPRFDVDRAIRVFATADRPPYWRGEAVTSELLWPSRPKAGGVGPVTAPLR